MESYSYTLIQEEINKELLLLKPSKEGKPLVAKMLQQEFPTPTELLQLENELEITRSLTIPQVRKAIRREIIKNRQALILEYFEGETLYEAFIAKKQPLAIFLKTAIQISHALGLLHREHIIHKDINKFNILVAIPTLTINIIDFEISSRIDVKKQFVGNPQNLEGTLAYISPEQTGRMNRRLDYRSDLYSLGVTFYEILTGQLPFTTTDLLELVHLHIAQAPQPPHIVNPDIPEVLSEIVLKLLSKNAEDRYQTAFGLQKDLEICLLHLEKQGHIPRFPIAAEDFSDQLEVVQKLYGREEERMALLTAFDEINNGKAALIMVEGQTGVGKSALVHEVHKPITEKHGFFIEGKFDQLQRNIPFYAFAQAFSELVNILLTESDTALQYWKDKIANAVGNLGKVVTDLIPSLELIIGKQLEVPKLGAAETQNRLLYVFRNFINEFCDKDHPFVLFLDDLQWADSGSLLLLSDLLNNSDTGYFLIIGAYRNNEVDAAHPLVTTLEAMEKAGITYATIGLDNLTLQNVTELVADTLHSSKEHIAPLAQIIHHKTQGNPFFLNQFIKTIYEEGLLFFNAAETIWQWKEKEIASLTSTDNVIELLVTKTQKLPVATQTVLKYAACIGNRFELTTLSILLNQSLAAINKDLFPALLEGLIMPRDNSFMVEEVTDERLLQQAAYYFIHDKVQQAVYSLIPENQKKQVHLTVGRLLLQSAESEAASEEKIFDIIYHINQGLDWVENETEKIRYAELNAMAGLKAKKNSAFKPAYNFYTTAIRLVGNHSWQEHYSLALEVYTEGAETAYLTGDTKTMNLWLEEVFSHARETLDLVKAYNIQIDAETSENRLPAALETGVVVLDKLGVHFPKKPQTIHILQALAKTQLQMKLKGMEHIPSLPAMTDPYKLEAMPILQRLIPAAYMSGSNLFPLIVFKMVRLSLHYGNTAPSALGYASFAITQTGILGNIEIGSRLGKISMEVLNKFNSEEYKVKVFFTVNNFIRHWKEPLRAVVDPLLESYHIGLKVGDLVGGTWSAYYRLLNQFYYGKNLAALEEEINVYTAVFIQYRQQAALDRTNLLLQLVQNLRGKNTDPISLNGSAFEEAKIEKIKEAKNDQTSVFCFYNDKAILAYLFGHYTLANQYAEQALLWINAVVGLPEMTTFTFYDTLIALAGYTETEGQKKKSLLKRAVKNLKKLQKWATYGPQNYQHKFLLANAEYLHIQGKTVLAATYYDQAATAARKHQYIQEEALIYERAGIFYQAKKDISLATYYLGRAWEAYKQWGSDGKVTQLEKVYSLIVPNRIRDMSVSSITSSTTSKDNLDLASVIKASTAISSEIALDKFMEQLMRIAIENAGAQRGVLFLVKEGKLVMQAEAKVTQNEISLQRFNQAEYLDYVPQSILQLTSRRKEDMVIEDCTQDSRFAQDPLVVSNGIKSVICFPIINRGNLIGLLYLENNLTAGAFTPERIEILKLLSGQIAVSIQNALVYDTLEEKVKERTAIIERQKEEIENEQQKSEKLLLEILPAKTAQELKKWGYALPRSYEQVSVMFADFVGFSKVAETIDAVTLVKEIDYFYSHFDKVILKHQLEKIKTIGDCYMCAGGLPEENTTHANDIVAAALEIQQFVEEEKQKRIEKREPYFEIRIGINTGPVVAGIVGLRKFAYDIWGDTVNVAARMEQNSMAGRINVSKSTYELIKEQFSVSYRGKIQAKNKGSIDMYFLEVQPVHSH